MSGVVFAGDPMKIHRGRLGFGSCACRSAARPPSATLTVATPTGETNYSFIRSASQALSTDNRLGDMREHVLIESERRYSAALFPSSPNCRQTEWSMPAATRQPFSLSLTAAGHGTARDRNPSAARDVPSTSTFAPELVTNPATAGWRTRCTSAQSTKSVSSFSNFSDSSQRAARPCSSQRMRDIWKLSFAPTTELQPPMSCFTAAPSTTSRDTFLIQEYTKKSSLLMRPSSGDSQRDAQYRPVTYLRETRNPSAPSRSRPFGDFSSHNHSINPRPSSSTYVNGLRGAANRSSVVTESNSMSSVGGRASSSKRECRCSSSTSSHATKTASPSRQ